MDMFRFSMDLNIQQKGGPQQKLPSDFELGLPTPSFSGSGWDAPDGKLTKKGGASQPGKKKMNFDDETVMKAL